MKIQYLSVSKDNNDSVEMNVPQCPNTLFNKKNYIRQIIKATITIKGYQGKYFSKHKR